MKVCPWCFGQVEELVPAPKSLPKDVTEVCEWCKSNYDIAPDEMVRVLAACEIQRVTLHTGDLYRFVLHTSCEACAQYVGNYESGTQQ